MDDVLGYIADVGFSGAAIFYCVAVENEEWNK